MKGWNEGIKPIKLFGDNKKPGETDAATSFTNGKSAASKTPALTAAASKGTVSGGVGGAKVINITLNANNPFRDSKFIINDLAADAKSVAEQFENWLMAQLDDVNTYASNLG